MNGWHKYSTRTPHADEALSGVGSSAVLGAPWIYFPMTARSFLLVRTLWPPLGVPTLFWKDPLDHGNDVGLREWLLDAHRWS
jgi:hypothetical protein